MTLGRFMAQDSIYSIFEKKNLFGLCLYQERSAQGGNVIIETISVVHAASGKNPTMFPPK